MKAFEIFREIQPETAKAVFQYLRDEQREVYTASLSTLAANRKLRPVFIQRKPGPAQIEWLAKNIKLKASDEIAEHVIQLWLMKARQEMLTAFLDGVGIEHDGEGAAEDLPESLDGKKLKTTVTKLLKEQDPEAVRIYLHVFQMQRPDGFSELTELIESTPELQFGKEEETPAAKAEPEPAPVEEEAPAEEAVEEPAAEEAAEESDSKEEE